MTYSEQIGTERIKDGSLTDTDMDTSTVPTLGGLNAWTAANTFSQTVAIDGVSGGQINFEGSVDTQPFENVQVLGDAAPRHIVTADGKHAWGDGAGAQDAALERDGVGSMAVVDAGIGVRQTGSPEQLVTLNSSGQVTFSDGVAAPVVSLLYDSFNAGMLVNSPVRFADVERHENIAHYSPNATIAFDLQTSVNHAAIQASQLAPGGPIYELNVSGKSRWGVDGIGYDVELYRSGADELTLDDNLIIDLDLTVNGQIINAGGFNSNAQQIAVNHAVNLATDYILLANSIGTAGLTVTLPAVHTIGSRVLVKDHVGGATALDFIKLISADGDTIDGAADHDIVTAWGFVEVVSNGTNWVIIGRP